AGVVVRARLVAQRKRRRTRAGPGTRPPQPLRACAPAAADGRTLAYSRYRPGRSANRIARPAMAANSEARSRVKYHSTAFTRHPPSTTAQRTMSRDWLAVHHW